MFVTIGSVSLVLALAATVLSVVALGVGIGLRKPEVKKLGTTFAFASTGFITLALLVLVYCFLAGDTSIYYVVDETSHNEGSLAWLFRLAGVWGGSQGSLLFWAWLISVFNTFVAVKATKSDELHGSALAVAELILAAFLGVLVFSESNNPFIATPDFYLNPDGTLNGNAMMLGMNMLLEHWAMAIHPPTLFVGYAGFTIPFAYAMAAVIENRASADWVRHSTPYAMVSWLLLSVGIGLGSVWAYVVLGWGGYWGWDPVENASLLPWLVGLALIHSFTVYRQRGAFKRWAIMCAGLSFVFVILGTFITRSGLVQSVHAFEGDPVSLYLFLGLILVSLAASAVGVALRWKSFSADTEDGDDIESFTSKDAAYYINNLVVILFAIILVYFTLSSALPAWLPLGGMSVSTGTFEAVARPLGILYCALMAVCPLLSWGKTDGKAFRKRALIPGICALVLFAGLLVIFFTKLLPIYQANVAAGGTIAAGMREFGPAWYYNGTAIVGLLVASLLVFNAGYLLVRTLSAKSPIRKRLSLIGGSLSHVAMGIILVGLIGSSMYVMERSVNMPYDSATDTASSTIQVGAYELSYTGLSSETTANNMIVYSVGFDATRNGRAVGSITPQYEISMLTNQSKLDAAVISFVDEDLFVVFSGLSNDYRYMVMDVRVNPLISWVWVGFGLLVLGMLLASFARRTGGSAAEPKPEKAE